MKRSQFLEVAGLVADLWPRQGWPADSLDSIFTLFEPIDCTAAIKTIRDIAEDGAQFAPTPGQVVNYARTLRLQPTLPAPDMTRDLTPEELAQAQDMANRLRTLTNRLNNPTSPSAGRKETA